MGSSLMRWFLVLSVCFIIITANLYPDYRDHPCIRPCLDDAPPMICKYVFTLEYYYVLSRACHDCPFNVTDCDRPHCVTADGASRAILVVNRMLPGPGIHVCQGDRVIVKVKNHLDGAEGTSIHWHGILQHDSPYMDGVAMVTQCPIPAHSSFQYDYKADSTGSMFWHSHAGLQRADGIYGPLVVRQPPSKEVHFGLYDFDLAEHTIIVNDWLVEMSMNRFSAHHHDDGDNKPKSMLINGKGTYQEFIDISTNEIIYTPYAVFDVEQGKRYRFRVASNGILNCPIQFSIDEHTLLVIATDGNPIKPIEVDSFNIFAGERYDFVLRADMTVDNYWLRVRGLADCGDAFMSAKQEAILRYRGAGDHFPRKSTHYDDARRGGKELNPWNRKGDENHIQVTELTSLKDDDPAVWREPDVTFYMALDFNLINNPHFHNPRLYALASFVNPSKRLYSPQINHISLQFPPAPPLGQLKDIPESMICNSETVTKNCSREFCECVHIIKVPLGSVVEVVMVDEGVPFDANHPMHLHGYGYRVVAMDRLAKSTSVETIKQMDRQGLIKRNLDKPVIKDTVTVPDGGYTIIRFYANNPGFWLYHCHIEFHIEIGMGLILQVGEISQIQKPPPNFPTCGDWELPQDEEYCMDNPDCLRTNSAIGVTSWSFSIAMVTLLISNIIYQVY